MAATKIVFTKGAPKSFRLLWSGPLDWMLSVAMSEGIIVKTINVHWHKELYGRKCPLGEADAENKSIMLCTHIYDKDTILHELAHLDSIGVHSQSWANRFLNLISAHLEDKELEVARFMAGRDYKEVAKIIGQKK